MPDAIKTKKLVLCLSKNLCITNFSILSPLVLFLLLTYLVVTQHPDHYIFELSFSQYLQSFQTPALTGFMQFVSFFGQIPIVVLVVILFFPIFHFLGQKREAIYILTVGGGNILALLIKNIILRPRPFSPDVKILEQAGGYSFPSNHVVHYVLFFGLLSYLLNQKKHFSPTIRLIGHIILYSLIILVSFSRVYLGAHWLLDVTSGYLLGLFLLQLILLLPNLLK